MNEKIKRKKRGRERREKKKKNGVGQTEDTSSSSLTVSYPNQCNWNHHLEHSLRQGPWARIEYPSSRSRRLRSFLILPRRTKEFAIRQQCGRPMLLWRLALALTALRAPALCRRPFPFSPTPIRLLRPSYGVGPALLLEDSCASWPPRIWTAAPGRWRSRSLSRLIG